MERARALIGPQISLASATVWSDWWGGHWCKPYMSLLWVVVIVLVAVVDWSHRWKCVCVCVCMFVFAVDFVVAALVALEFLVSLG